MAAVANVISALSSASDAASKQVQGQIEMLMALAEAKKQQQGKLIDDRIAQASQNKEIPPAVKMLDQSDVRVVSSTGPAAGITSAVDGLLQNAQANWKTAVGSLIGTALNALLGQAAGASQDMVLYVVALDGKPESAPGAGDSTLAPVRIDYCLWSYNISESSVKDTASSAVAYTARKYIIDLKALPDDLTMKFVLQNIGVPAALVTDWISQTDELKKNQTPIHNYLNRELPTAQVAHARQRLGLIVPSR